MPDRQSSTSVLSGRDCSIEYMMEVGESEYVEVSFWAAAGGAVALHQLHAEVPPLGEAAHPRGGHPETAQLHQEPGALPRPRQEEQTRLPLRHPSPPAPPRTPAKTGAPRPHPLLLLRQRLRVAAPLLLIFLNKIITLRPTPMDCAPPPVSVYLRLPNAKSLKVQQPRAQTVAALKANISQLMGIPVEDQVVILRGRELVEGTVELADKAILHVKDMGSSQGELTVNVVKHRPQTQNIFKINSHQLPTLINPQETIAQFLHRFMGSEADQYNLPKTYVVESGRILKHSRTFAEEKIQNGTQMHLILRENSVENEKKEDLDHEIFIRSVLKLSRNNSIMERHKDQSPQKHEPFPFNLFSAQIEQQNRQQTKIPSQKIEVIEKLDLGGIAKWNPEYEKISLYKEYPPRLYNPTKASLMSASQKVIKQKITPLKFGLKNHKKYDGPKSQRDCHCKEKKTPPPNLKTERLEPTEKWEETPPEPKPKPKRVNTRLSLKF